MSFFDARTAELSGKFPASGPIAVELIPASGPLPGPLSMWVQPWHLTEPDPSEAILIFTGAANGANWIFTTPDISPLNRVSGRIVLAVGGVPVAAGYAIGSVDSTMTRHETLTVDTGPVGITLTVSTPGATTLTGLSDFDPAGDPGDVVTRQADGTYALEPPAGGAGTWGSIGGAIGDQTDLANALAAKADTSSLAAIATSGAYSDLSGKPSLGSAAAANTTDFAAAVHSHDITSLTTSGPDGKMPVTASGGIALVDPPSGGSDGYSQSFLLGGM